MHFLTAGEPFFQISPVHTLKCTSHRADTPQLLAAPWLVRIRRLSISVDNEETSTELLFSAPTLAELEELELRSWRFRPAGSPVEKPTLASLRRLVLDDHRDGSQFVSLARLAELLHPQAQLGEFVLGGAFYNASALADLAALPQLGRLERFTMHSRTGGDGVPRPPLTPTGIRALTTAPFWATLRAFRYESLWDFSSGYRYCGGLLDEPEAEEVAAAPPNPHLRTFVLTSGRLGKAVSALASSPLLASVATLDLSGTPLGDAGADLLARSPYLGRLVRLNLAGCKVGPKGMKAIADAPWAANIVRMDIRGCPIRMQGVDALIAPGNFPRLKRLDAYMAAKTTAQKEQLTARYGNAVRFDCRD